MVNAEIMRPLLGHALPLLQQQRPGRVQGVDCWESCLACLGQLPHMPPLLGHTCMPAC